MAHTLGVGFAILFEFGIDPARVDQSAIARDVAGGIR
jgi:hypothetical protein